MEVEVEVAAMVVGEAEVVVIMEAEAGEEVVTMEAEAGEEVVIMVVAAGEEAVKAVVVGGKVAVAGEKAVVEETKVRCIHQSLKDQLYENYMYAVCTYINRTLSVLGDMNKLYACICTHGIMYIFKFPITSMST